jgi:putative Holliday junction resolvase
MRWLGVDLGKVRLGMALSEDDEGPSSVLGTVTIAAGGEVDAIAAAATEHRADRIVLGLPLEMSGKEGLAARRARTLGKALAGRVPSIEVAFVDERLTSQEAHRLLAASGRTAREQKQRVDQLAAKILLDTHLGIVARRLTR